jgi:hypothetical protein
MRIGVSWQWCGLAALSAAMLYAGALPVGVGYLPRVGPGPLRFRSAVRANASAVLPPLRMSDENTNAPIELAVTTNEPPNQTEVSDADFQFLPPEMVTPLEQSQNAPQNFPGPMVPQMLLRYFTRGTNQPQAIISAPIEFTPPPPPLTRSSAVYISK